MAKGLQEREREYYLDNPIMVFLTKCVVDCVKNQATDSSIKRDLKSDIYMRLIQ